MTVLVSLGSYAQEVTEIEKEHRSMIHENLGTIVIRHSEKFAPYIIEVDAPSGTIKSISGLTNTNIQNWYVSNGRLTIYLSVEDLEVLYPRDEFFYIEMGTSVGVATIYIKVVE